MVPAGDSEAPESPGPGVIVSVAPGSAPSAPQAMTAKARMGNRNRMNPLTVMAALLPRVYQLAELDQGLVGNAALDGDSAGRHAQLQLLDDLRAGAGGPCDGHVA